MSKIEETKDQLLEAIQRACDGGDGSNANAFAGAFATLSSYEWPSEVDFSGGGHTQFDKTKGSFKVGVPANTVRAYAAPDKEVVIEGECYKFYYPDGGAVFVGEVHRIEPENGLIYVKVWDKAEVVGIQEVDPNHCEIQPMTRRAAHLFSLDPIAYSKAA